MMDDRNELSEILLGNTRQKSSNGKKSIIIVLMAVAVIVLVAFAMWKFLGANEEKISKSNAGTIDKSIATPFENDDFGNIGGMDFDPNAIDDSLLKGMENIQNPKDTPKSDEAETSSLDMIINRLTGGSSQAQQTSQQQTSPQQAHQQPLPQQNLQATQTQAKQNSQPATQPANAPTPQAQSLRPQNGTLGANGTAPTTGFYWQLGSFSKEPKAEFISLVKKYSYRVQRITNKNGLTTTRYLLGPYPSEAQAPSREDVQKIFSESPIRVFIP